MSTTASKGNRIAILAKLNNAQKSCRLLKQKYEALERKRRSLAEQICILKDSMGDIMGEAYFSLAEAKFICRDFSSFVLYSASQACCTVQMCTENVYGIVLRSCTLIERDDDDQFKSIGLSWSSSHLKKVRENFREVLRLLINVISTQMSFQAVDEGMKRTISAVNALEHVIIPNMEAMLAKIVIELDELEREEFYRLKKVQKMKQVAETRKREDRMPTYQILSEIRTSSILSVSASYSESFWIKKRESSYNILANIPQARFKKLLKKYSGYDAKDNEIDERLEFEEKDEGEEEEDEEEADIEEEEDDEGTDIEEEDESEKEEKDDDEANIEEEDEGKEEEKGDEGAEIEEKVEKEMKDYEEETKDGEEDDEFDMDRVYTRAAFRDRLSKQTENNNLSLDSGVEISGILPSYGKISFQSYVPQTSSRIQLFADTESSSSSQYDEGTLRSNILELYEEDSSSEDEYDLQSPSAEDEITRTRIAPVEQTCDISEVDKRSVKGAKDYVPEIEDIIPKIKLVSPVDAQPAIIAIVKDESKRSIKSDLIQDSEVFVCKTELASAATLIRQDAEKSGTVDNLRKDVIAEEYIPRKFTYLVEDDYSGKVSDGIQERAFHEDVGVDTSEVYRKKTASPPVLFDLIRSSILGESESPSDSPQQRVEEVHPPLAEISAHKQDLDLPAPEESVLTIDLIQTIITEEARQERLGETSHPTALFVPPKEKSVSREGSIPKDLITYEVCESSVTSETLYSVDELSDTLKYDEIALESSGEELLKTSEYTPVEIEEKISIEYRCPVLGTQEKSVPTPSEPEEKPPSLWDTLFSNQHNK